MSSEVHAASAVAPAVGPVAATRHPSPLDALSLTLALAGLALAAYLTVAHYDRGALVCAVGDCHAVQSSDFATVLGLPVAGWGAAMYAALAGLGGLRIARPGLRWPATYVALLVAFAGALYSAYLTWVELSVLRAICQWCVVSALLVVGLLLTEATQAWRLARTPLAG